MKRAALQEASMLRLNLSIAVVAAAVASAVVVGPASAAGFCERLETKIASPGVGRDVEARLKQAVRRAAAEGCDASGGMFADGHCVGQVAQIRKLERQLREGTNRSSRADNLRAMYRDAGCERRSVTTAASRPGIRRPDQRPAISRIPQDAFDQPIIEVFIPVTRAVAELENTQPTPHAVKPERPPFDAVEYARLQQPRPIPVERQNVRVVGHVFLPADSSGVGSLPQRKVELSFAERLLHQAVALIGNAFLEKPNVEIADAGIDPLITSAVQAPVVLVND